MKKSLWLALIGALMAFAISACSGDTPQAGNPDIVVDAGNNDNLPDDSYSIVSLSGDKIYLEHDDSAEILLKVVNSENELVEGASLLLTLEMSARNSASFSASSSNTTSVAISTDADGIATAQIYSASKNATGTITATLPGHDCNTVEFTVTVNEEDGGGGTEETTGSVAVTLNNPTSATSAELYIKEIENSSSTSGLCDDFMAGYEISSYTSMQYVRSLGTTASQTFKGMTVGKKVVVYAYGQVGNDVVASGCVESTGTVSASTPLNVVLDLQAYPPNFDNNYDAMLGIDFTNIMPDSWKTWFDLIDNIFTSPVGTAIYYALWYWEYRGQQGVDGADYENGGGTPTLLGYNVWDTITGDMALGELFDACGIPGGTATATCPTFSAFGLINLQLFPLAVTAAEDALAEIDGFGATYEAIKTVGQNILSMAKSFDVGARFQLAETASGLSITETWTHVVWTWQLNDESPECAKGTATYDAATCGRHAFNFAKTDYASSVVHTTYEGTYAANSSDGYTVTLPSDHSFVLKYGALLKILIDDVVVPQIMNNDKDGLDSDGDTFTRPVASDASLGTLLNYWIPCGKVSVAVYDWLTGINTIGPMIGGILTASALEGYCEQGLDAAGDYAMKQLATLVADANIKVKQGSSFELNDIDGDRIPTSFEDLDYLIGVTVENTDENGNVTSTNEYNAHLTGEGILAVDPLTAAHCADFLSLSDTAAQAACGN